MRLSLMKGAAWQVIGIKPGFGLNGIPPRWTGSFLSATDPQVHDHLHPAWSAVEVRGIPLKPKYGLNGAPTIC
jgi:hypothetical protein